MKKLLTIAIMCVGCRNSDDNWNMKSNGERMRIINESIRSISANSLSSDSAYFHGYMDGRKDAYMEFVQHTIK